MKPAKYRVLKRIAWGPAQTRANPGDEPDSIPERAVEFFLRKGAIELIAEVPDVEVEDEEEGV